MSEIQTLQAIRDYLSENKLVILSISGVSGSGKTTLESKLINQYPDLFHKLPQMTTRERRDASDPYVFISHRTYMAMRHLLIAKTQFNGNYYGTIPDLRPGKINTVIASEQGLRDLMTETYNRTINQNLGLSPDVEIELFRLGIDMSDDEIQVYRPGRDPEFMAKEREVLKLCDKVMNGYVNPPEVLEFLAEYMTGMEYRIREDS